MENSRKYVTDQKTDRQTCTKIYTSTDRHTETHTDTRIQRQIERKRDRKRNMLRNGDGKTKMLSRSSDKIRLSMFRQSLSVIIILFKVYHGKKTANNIRKIFHNLNFSWLICSLCSFISNVSCHFPFLTYFKLHTYHLKLKSGIY